MRSSDSRRGVDVGGACTGGGCGFDACAVSSFFGVAVVGALVDAVAGRGGRLVSDGTAGGGLLALALGLLAFADCVLADERAAAIGSRDAESPAVVEVLGISSSCWLRCDK